MDTGLFPVKELRTMNRPDRDDTSTYNAMVYDLSNAARDNPLC